MFHLFGKKKSEPVQESEPTLQPPVAAELSAQFQEDEFDITAVTGPNGFGGDVEDDGQFHTVTLPLIAWREEDGPIHEEDTCLIALADDTLLDYLKRLAPRDSIIQARVRQGLDDDRFLLVKMPAPVVDPELKVILDERTKEVSSWVSGLGTFVLNRSVNWFQTEVDWLGQSIQLTYDNGSDEDMKAAQHNALTLVTGQQDWDKQVRQFAVTQLRQENLAELADLSDGELSRRLEVESLQVWGDGRFEFWFHDGDYVWESSVRVNGTLSGGAAQLHLEG